MNVVLFLFYNLSYIQSEQCGTAFNIKLEIETKIVEFVELLLLNKYLYGKIKVVIFNLSNFKCVYVEPCIYLYY